jgi:hypothetical protein
MNEDYKQKLIELMNEAKELRMPAVQVVLHMLLGSHTNGTQAAFAKWCCQFSPFQAPSLAPSMEVYEDFPDELNLDE